MRSQIQIGIDIGGTFTDFVAIHPDSGEIISLKVPSTPANPAEAVLNGLSKLRASFHQRGVDETVGFVITHGSTVATNALLERKGAKTALITTRGFHDILQIGRQNRQKLYDLLAGSPTPLVPEELRFEVDERVESSGSVSKALDSSDLEKILEQLEELKVESIAVCLLFSFLHPEHERMIKKSLSASGLSISLSSEILPEYREYERMSTTTVNAYVSPILDRYLLSLEESLSSYEFPARLRVMQSNGGNISVSEARRAGVRCILSGPAGGIIGSSFVSRLALDQVDRTPVSTGEPTIKIITFDMGGTSTDVSLIDRSPIITTESEIGGFPISIPMLDIHTIGAGGGSIAYIDPGLALRVGPQSAGADPGPACYGRGDPKDARPTVTDANLVLGRLPADHFLGGEIQLDPNRATDSISHLGAELGLDVYSIALGIIEVVNTHMERALRVISVERGYDPEEFTLLSFGGAGGLHASDLACRLGISRILIPPLASTLSAFGMVSADVIKDYSRTVMLPGDTDLDTISSAIRPLLKSGEADLIQEGIPSRDIDLETSLDMRYRGQSYELTIPFSMDYIQDSDTIEDFIRYREQAFHLAHRKQYGYSRPHSQTEIVNVRVRAIGRTLPPIVHALPWGDTDPAIALLDRRQVFLSHTSQMVPFYLGESLLPGNRIPGPAVVIRKDTTILIQPGDTALVDPYLNLIITVKE